jgi:hypothetical protein
MSAQSAAVQEVGPAKPSTDDRIANLARAMKLGKSDPVKDINSYLEHRTRELSTVIRLLEHQRVHLRSLEQERDTAYDRFNLTVAAVQEAARGLTEAMERDAKPGDSQIEAEFDKSQRGLNELEALAVILRANYLNWRGAWEQYEATRERAKSIRAEMQDSY